jgi:branched-chain amino acid aminotransferase
MSLAFHNGRFVPYSELSIAPHDAGFVFGATVTDFCRTYAHKLFRWPDHLARLRRDCEACFVPLPYTDADLTAAAEELVKQNTKALPPGDDLALITFATPGPLGYTAGTDNGPPTVAMHTFPIPKERYRRFFTEGVVLEMAGLLPRTFDPPTSVKHRNRIHWWSTSRRQPVVAGSVPALYAPNADLDTAIGAVLSVRAGVLHVPTTETVLNSVSVNVVRELATAIGLETSDGLGWKVYPKDMGESEVMLCGSAFGIAGVRAYHNRTEQKHFPWPGPVFTKLSAAWSELVGVDVVRQFTG